MPRVPTLNTGDCLFAAFAISITGRRMPFDAQMRAATTLRRAVGARMRTRAFWRGVPRSALLEAPDVARLRALQVPSATLDMALTYPAAGSRAAYIDIMERHGVWGGFLELRALAEMYNVRIRIVPLLGPEYTAAGHMHHRVVRLFLHANHYEGIVT
jgi:hypothetical protein